MKHSRTRTTRVCIVGASGKLGKYIVLHTLDRDYEVVGVRREHSVWKLDAFKGRITIIPGATKDRGVIKRAVAGCDGILTVLVPWGLQQYSTGTAQAVLFHHYFDLHRYDWGLGIAFDIYSTTDAKTG